MPKIFQYVCDKCSKTKFSEESGTPENWWVWGGMYFCPECFGSLRKPVCAAMDALEKYLGSLLTGDTPNKRRRATALITHEVAHEIWATLPRPEEAD